MDTSVSMIEPDLASTCFAAARAAVTPVSPVARQGPTHEGARPIAPDRIAATQLVAEREKGATGNACGHLDEDELGRAHEHARGHFEK